MEEQTKEITKVHSVVQEEEWPRAFRMLGEAYRDEKSLFEGITKDVLHWQEASQLLYTRILEQFFVSFRTDIARAAQQVNETWGGKDRDKGLAVFLKSLYAQGSLVWKGYTFKDLQALGDAILSASEPTFYVEMLQKHYISHWVENTYGACADETTKKLINDIEMLADKEPSLACYWFGNSFATQRTLRICNGIVNDIDGLILALTNSAYDFYSGDGLKKLLSKNEGADLYGFLYSFGYKTAIENMWNEFGKCDEYNKVCKLFVILDHIAENVGADVSLWRQFFVEYGPIGILTYTQRLIAESNVYEALDAQGEDIMFEILTTEDLVEAPISDILAHYTSLNENITKFRKILQDNPYCIEGGMYAEKGAICKNLKGCFAFEIFGRLAPLGFSTWIEKTDRGRR